MLLQLLTDDEREKVILLRSGGVKKYFFNEIFNNKVSFFTSFYVAANAFISLREMN